MRNNPVDHGSSLSSDNLSFSNDGRNGIYIVPQPSYAISDGVNAVANLKALDTPGRIASKPPSPDEAFALETRVEVHDASEDMDSSNPIVERVKSRTAAEQVLEPMDEVDARVDPRFREGLRTPPPTLAEAEYLAREERIDWRYLSKKEFWMKRRTIREFR